MVVGMFVPESATISEAAALLCRGLERLERLERLEERRLSRGCSSDALLPAKDPGSTDEESSSSSAELAASSSSSGAAAGAGPAAAPRQARTNTQWEDWFTLASFSHPHVMSRLERLMGTNVVRITDRRYMLELQRRIREDHIRSVKDRIRAREVDELEREKKLILDGRMSLDEAPQELVDHPVFQISQFIKNVLVGGKVATTVSTRSTSSRASNPALSRSGATSEEVGERGTTPASTSLSPRPSTPTSTKEGSSRAGSPRPSSASGGSRSQKEKGEEEEEEVAAEPAAEGSLKEGSPRDSVQQDSPRVSVSVKDETADAEPGPVVQVEPGPVVQVEEAEEAEEEGEEEGGEEGGDEPEPSLLSGLSACDFEEDMDRQADIEKGYMFSQEDYDRIKFETESVKKMWELETVEELYELAEAIVREIVAQKGAGPTVPRTPSPAPSIRSTTPAEG